MMKLNSLGESFIKNPRRNYQRRITTSFYKELITIYLLLFNEYKPKQFKEYVQSLSILDSVDWDRHDNGYERWKHYIDEAKQQLLEKDGLIEKIAQGNFIIPPVKKRILLEKYSKYFEDIFSPTQIEQLINSLENSPSVQEQFNPSNLTDARERILGSIVQRRGQTDFRQELLKAYEFKCAVSECNVPEALEASHIIPYMGPKTNQIQNGILLRADIHTLFDLRLLTIDEEKYSVIISPKLKNTYYSQYEGKIIKLPNKTDFYPSKEALRKHREESAL